MNKLLDGDGLPNESDEQFSARIRAETREKILLKSTPINLEALKKFMELPDPGYSGNLNRRDKPTS